MLRPDANGVMSGVVFGGLAALAATFAAAGGSALAVGMAATGGFAAGFMVRTNRDGFARDVGSVVLVGAIVAAALVGVLGALERTPGLPAPGLAAVLLGAALVPFGAASVDRGPRTPPAVPELAMAGTTVVAIGASLALFGVEDGAAAGFFTAMAVTVLALAGRIGRLAPAFAALALQGVVALLVSWVAGELGEYSFAESALRLALVLPVLAPAVAGVPKDRRPTAALPCLIVAVTTALAGSVVPRDGAAWVPLPVVAVVASAWSAAAWGLSRASSYSTSSLRA